MDPRRVPAGTEVSYTTPEGETKTLKAEGDAKYSYITPSDPQAEAALAAFDYPIARKVQRSAETPVEATDNQAAPDVTADKAVESGDAAAAKEG